MTLPSHSFSNGPVRVRYHMLVLCLWQESGGAEPIWRFSLESLHTTDRRGFGSLKALIDYLQALMDSPTIPPDPPG